MARPFARWPGDGGICRAPGGRGVALGARRRLPARWAATLDRGRPLRPPPPRKKFFKGLCLACSVRLAGAVTSVIVRVAAELTLGSEHASLDFPDMFRPAETEPAIQDRG